MADCSGTDRVTRRVAPFAEWDAAVRLLGACESDGDGSGREVRSVVGGSLFAPGGLRVAVRDERMVGAILIQPTSGAVAFLWPPRLVPGEPESTARALIEDCLHWAFDQSVRIVQACVEPSDERAASRLETASFLLVAEIEYLTAPTWNRADMALHAADRLEFVSVSDASALDLLGRVIERTYGDSRDCPRLDGLRSIDEVLDGYRSTGVYRPDWWRIVLRRREPVGCLLLADHPAADQVELMYMGIVPEHRGKGLARDLVIQAHRVACEAGRSRIVLAVDRANDAARAAYRGAGFESWGRRVVWVRTFSAWRRREVDGVTDGPRMT
ncbi:MAG: GNAT family N-acetyltransferase [Planctomycetes bacterium]|nr:GNAT family N-acetyltransferase [Planctomycetota bacterium]